jgi:hypothetical protein
MKQLELEATSPPQSSDRLSNRPVQRVERRQRQPKEIGLRVVLRGGERQQFSCVGSQSETLHVAADPREVGQDSGVFQAGFSRLGRQFKRSQHKQVQAAKALSGLPSPRDPNFETSPHVGEQGDDSIGLTHVHLTEDKAVQSPSHVTEIKK